MEILEESAAFPSALPVRRDLPWSAWVTIQIGCDNACAFCIVPSVRGREISRPVADVVGEVEALAAAGTVEVTLLGQNVNSYGRDLTRRGPLFAQLLRAVGGVEGIRRVRYTSPHPKDLRPETIAAMAETPSVCEHLHLPLQSGSDAVLAAMHRGYTAERYLARLAAARAAVADLALTTDIIVGFPGETDADFAMTLEVVAEAGYDSAYTFIFSPRPGTEAATRTDDLVPAAVVAERFERLRVVVERSALARHQARGAGRGGRGRGAEQEDPECAHRSDPPEQVGALPLAPAPGGGHLRRRTGDCRRSPPPQRRAGGRHRRSPTPHPDPRRLGVTRGTAGADPFDIDAFWPGPSWPGGHRRPPAGGPSRLVPVGRWLLLVVDGPVVEPAGRAGPGEAGGPGCRRLRPGHRGDPPGQRRG